MVCLITQNNILRISKVTMLNLLTIIAISINKNYNLNAEKVDKRLLESYNRGKFS